MKKSGFIEYDKEMSEINDPKELKARIEENSGKIQKKSKLPVAASLMGGWGSLALFLLTGFLSGWTVGVLWVVASIAGAGILSSAVAGFVGHLKYGRFFRAMRNREKLLKLKEDNKDHFDAQRMRLEKKLGKDLAYCVKKRMISHREQEYYASVLPRPTVLPQQEVSTPEEISAEAQMLNASMAAFKGDVEKSVTQYRVSQAGMTHEANVERTRHFEGDVILSTPERGTDGGPKQDPQGQPVYIESKFRAESDQDFAFVLKGVAEQLRVRARDGRMPFPITIEANDKDGHPIAIDTIMPRSGIEGKIVITREDMEMLLGSANPIDEFADELLSQLPERELTPEDEQTYTQNEQQIVGQDQAQSEKTGETRSAVPPSQDQGIGMSR